MAIRFRKSFKVAPGVKFNLGKKSAGISFGNKYFRKTYSTSGRKTASSSIPGTGITFMNTSTKKKKNMKTERKADEVKPVNRQPENIFEETAVPEVNNGIENTAAEPSKPKLWLWAVMAVVLLGGLWYLLGNGVNTPEVSNEATNTNSATVTTTQFRYSPEDVELKMMNGSLTAFVGERQVPFSGIVSGAEGSYVLKDGVVDASLTGVYNNNGVTQLVRSGKLDTSSSGVVPAGNGDWYLAQNGVVETAVTGIRDNEYGSWYVKEGQVQLDFSGLTTTDGKEYVLTDGKVDKSENGVYSVNGDWVYADNGEVHTDYTGVRKNSYGRWYVNNGHVDFGYNGVAQSDGSTYLIKDGKVDTTQNGVMKVGNTWAYVSEGMINTNFTGVATNEYGSWYVRKGIVQLDYDGVVTANGGQRYNVSNGKATVVTTTRAAAQSYGSGTGSRTQNNNVGSGIVASSNSNVYHHSWCSSAKQIKGSNLIHFSSVGEAQASGRRPCKRCF